MDPTKVSEHSSLGGLVIKAVLALLALKTAHFFYRLFTVRTLFRDVARKHGITILPHSFWFGHMAIIGRIRQKYPAGLLSLTLPQLVAEEYPDVASQSVLYIDLWPFSYPIMTVLHPNMIAQFTQDVSLPKHPVMKTEFMPFSGCKDLLNLSGQEWKTWRSRFNSGFSTKNLMVLVPSFVEEIDVFRDWLGEVAKTGEIVALDTQAMALTTDTIGRATLGIRMNCQRVQNPLLTAIKDQIRLLIVDSSPQSILKHINPRRILHLRRNNRIMKDYLAPMIERAAAVPVEDENSSQTGGPKTIMSLAIKAYLDETQSAKRAERVDSTFVEMAIAQIKIFILAGHDTTSATLSFAYHLLNKHPETLERIRGEHTDVFGKDPAKAGEVIRANPQTLNQLPYTTAVIKETLRLFPPASAVRLGSENFHLTHPDTGVRYPTKDMMLFSCHMAVHRNEQIWPRPHDFVPERWLAREGEPLHVHKNAFRPFELGPRNCIGQELALLELRAILAMTIRDFDIQSMYSEDDPEWHGDKCFPVSNPGEFATGHPAKSLPVKVTRRR